MKKVVEMMEKEFGDCVKLVEEKNNVSKLRDQRKWT